MLACDDIMPTGWTPAAASSILEEWTRTFSQGQQCSCFRITVFFNSYVTCTQEQLLGFELLRECRMCFTQHQEFVKDVY